MSSGRTVSIRVNGEHRRVHKGLSLAQLASEELGLDPAKVAVERNLEVVPRSTLGDVLVEDGDELEIVHFVGGGMAIERIVPNRFVADVAEGKTFYVDILGLSVAMEMDFITTFRSEAESGAQISLISEDPSGLEPAYSVGVDNVVEIHERAIGAHAEIVYPLTQEPWGVTRFMMRDPSGAISNIVQNGVVER